MKKNKYRNAPRRRKNVFKLPFRRSANSGKIKRRKNHLKKYSKLQNRVSFKMSVNRVWKVFIGLFKFPTVPKLLLFIAIFSIGFLIYKITQTNYFGVKKIQLTGNKQISTSSIEEQCRNNFSRNIFILSVGEIENEIEKMSIYIKKIHAEKILPDTIAINIEEREPIALWRTVNGAYLIDNEGFILERAVNENVNLDVIQSAVLTETDEQNENEQIATSEEQPENPEDKTEEQKTTASVFLGEELEKQIDWELKQREKEINLFEINFDDYLKLPDLFKKYPQVKVWSDEIFNAGTYTDTELLDKYLELTGELNNSPFEIAETLVFSESKTLVNFREGFKVYFKLDSEIRQQVMTLNLIYSKLQMEGVNFKEIDLRFKRPVVRE